MILTDSHTHLYLKEFKEDIREVMNRSLANNIERFFLPNIDSSSIDDLLLLQNCFPQYCFPMTGLHPCSVKENYEEELITIFNRFNKNKFYAIGEVGIDLYWDKTFINEQISAFRKQIAFALEHDLPIVIHCRNSFDEIIKTVEEFSSSKLKGIFHCFTGTADQAKNVIELGFHIGIGGVVTFKNSGLDEVVKKIDLNYIVLETDSPYLTPVPFRGKRNESSYLIHIAKKVAELKDTNIEQVAEITTYNTRKIFCV